MAWSIDARWNAAHGKVTTCGRKTCSNCLHYALEWREWVSHILNQQRLEVA